MEGGPDPATLREDMLDGMSHAMSDLPNEIIRDAMATVPRHEFVEEAPYSNRSTWQGGTRVLAPRTVARLLDALGPSEDDDVLVVGSGIGYTPAVLAEIVGGRHVHAVDIDRRMVHTARENLDAAGYDAVLVDRRDGSRGFPEYAPFDRILVEAATIEAPPSLLDQLASGGRLVFPQGQGRKQTLVAVDAQTGDQSAPNDPGTGPETVGEFGPVTFRPLLVDGEQPDAPIRNRTEREDRERDRTRRSRKTGWEHEWIDWDGRLHGTDR